MVGALKDEVIRAIEFRSPTCIPTMKHWYTRELLARYPEELADLMAACPDHVAFAEFEVREAYFEGGADEWGCRWEKSPSGVGAHATASPLTDWSRLGEYLSGPGGLPPVDRARRLEIARRDVAAAQGRFVAGRLWRTFAERIAALRGMENFLLDLYLNPGPLQQLCEALCGFILEMVGIFKDAGVDGIFLGDDWGTQTGPLISPELWRKTFKPWYRKMCRAIHDLGLYVFFHSCGNVAAFIDDFIDVGVDVLNPIQPNAMDLAWLARAYGGRMCFFGGVDTQRSLAAGTPEDVRREVEWLVAAFGGRGGGYIGSPSTTIMPETPLANIQAMCRAFVDARRCPRMAADDPGGRQRGGEKPIGAGPA